MQTASPPARGLASAAAVVVLGGIFAAVFDACPLLWSAGHHVTAVSVGVFLFLYATRGIANVMGLRTS